MRQLLANVLDIVSGQIDPMLQPYCEMPHVGGENIEAGTGHIVGMNTAKELGLTSGKYLFSNEHVLYSKIRPNLNKVALPSSEGICSADIYPLQPKPGVLAREFLAHLLRSADFLAYAQKHSSRTSIPKLNRQSLLGYQALLPPLPEQRRIAEVLDRAEALRAKRRAALSKLDALTQAIFLDLFGDPATNVKGWPLSTIGDVAEQVTDGEHLTPKRTTEGIKLLSARNIRDGYVDFGNVDYIGSEEYERIKRRCDPSLGDVLISCSGTIGRVASVETNEPFALVRSVALVRPKNSAVGSKFLEHYLRTPALRARMLRRANASSQANLFQGQIRELPVYAPPLALQNDFARRVAAVEKLKTAQQASLAKLDALFASLQHRAFRGEL